MIVSFQVGYSKFLFDFFKCLLDCFQFTKITIREQTFAKIYLRNIFFSKLTNSSYNIVPLKSQTYLPLLTQTKNQQPTKSFAPQLSTFVEHLFQPLNPTKINTLSSLFTMSSTGV
jgi:hypothetical protein